MNDTLSKKKGGGLPDFREREGERERRLDVVLRVIDPAENECTAWTKAHPSRILSSFETSYGQ